MRGEIDFDPCVGGSTSGGGGGAIEVPGGEASGHAETAAGFHHESGDIAAGAGGFFECLCGGLGSFFGSAVVLDFVMEGFVETVEEGLGTGFVGFEESMLGEEISDGGGVVAVGRGAVSGGDGGFEGVVDDGERDGVGGPGYLAGERGVAEEDDFVVDGEFVGGFEKINEGDGVAEDVAGPGEIVVGGDVEFEGFDADVVSFARAQDEAVRSEGDGFGVAVGGAMGNAE